MDPGESSRKPSGMPHLFTNRPRLYDLTQGSQAIRKQFRWETINAVFYKLGGLVFIAGSIFFFPRLDAYADLGAWIFFAGSLLYLVVTFHDMMEVLRFRASPEGRTRRSALELVAATTYLTGTILFTVGSIFFLSWVDWIVLGAWCFIIGSVLFVLGASVNVLQIVRAKNLILLQLMNLTAVSFVAGSVLFTVASIPYLWQFEAAQDRRILLGYLAAQYLAGSIGFFLGGVFNYWRAYIVMREALKGHDVS